MPVSDSYRRHVVEQLGRVVPALRARRMFGGVGLYADDLFFAVVADDTLYLKVDDATRAPYAARGMPPFRPYGDDRASVNYRQLPEEVLEDADALREWVDAAVGVARRARGSAAGRRARGA